jgi:hypothetical protein
MSIFASRTQQTIDLPFDVPHTVTIQKLAGRHLEQAKQANQAAAVESLRRMGGATFQRELNAIGPSVVIADAVAKVQANPLSGYDRYVLLEKGIKAWTYVDDAGAVIPVTAAAIEDLDDEAIDFLARAVLQLTKPALFAVDAEADQKNG